MFIDVFIYVHRACRGELTDPLDVTVLNRLLFGYPGLQISNDCNLSRKNGSESSRESSQAGRRK